MHDNDLAIFLAMRRIYERRLDGAQQKNNGDLYDESLAILATLRRWAEFTLSKADFEYYTRGY